MNALRTPWHLALLLAVATPISLAAESIPTGGERPVPESADRYWQESLSGGPGKDGIPSIDRPRFEAAGSADGWLDPGDPVIGIHHNGVARAYPQSILVWHEIVNDTIGGDNVAVTYCPLTGTALGFERGEDDLGVSGRLVNSNLIMYNRASDTYWPQILASGVHGPQTGEALREIRLFWTSWAQWRERHPETEVLSRRTGHARNYRRDPYGGYNPPSGYYAGEGILFPVFERSDRYEQKAVVFGFRVEDTAFAVDLDDLARTGHRRIEHNDRAYLILHDPGLETAWVLAGRPDEIPADPDLADMVFGSDGPVGPGLENLRSVPGFKAMWFAWYAFYPDTVVIDGR